VYDIVFTDDRGYYTVLQKRIPTLLEAGRKRKVNGDLVVHTGSFDVVTNRGWLWPDLSLESYALRKIAQAKGKS
jgi:hypothetical protein